MYNLKDKSYHIAKVFEMSNFAKKVNQLKHRFLIKESRLVIPIVLFILICVIVAVSFTFYDSKNVVLRDLAPKDTIIYLETNDLGNALNALTENQSFNKIAKSKTDFSAIEGIQVAIAISGFATSENPVTESQSVLNFKPKFTAIAETHAWSWQVNSLVENNLNSFVKKAYGNEAKLERKSVNNTERFIWTSADGRKTFAVISDSQVFFGNDEETLNKCLAAKRGETESLLKNENLAIEYEKSEGKLAFGFISKAGIKQIADLVGVSVAVGQTENSNARGFIARILPQVLNNSTKEISWTAEKFDRGIKDEIFIKTEREISNVLTETLVPANKEIDEIYDFLPLETSAVTRYNLKNPQVAFRSLVLLTAKNTDPANAKIIGAFSNSLLLQYGIADAEGFLSGVEPELITAKTDINGDESVAIVKAKDFQNIKQTFLRSIVADEELSKQKNIEIWVSEEDNLAVANHNNILIMGDLTGVIKCLDSLRSRQISPIETEKDFTKSALFGKLRKSDASTSTFVKDRETAENIVKTFGDKNNKNATSTSLTETRFNKQGIKRNYESDYGFLGVIIEQFNNE